MKSKPLPETPGLLDKRLTSRRYKPPEVILLGARFDPYPRNERDEHLTRILIEVLAKHNYPLHIITYSSLVLRDIDIITELNEQIGAQVSLVLPGLSATVLRSIETSKPPPSERIRTLNRIRRTGIQTGIIFNNLVPGVNDSPRKLDNIFKRAAEMNLDYLLFPIRVFENAADRFNKKFTEMPDSKKGARKGESHRKAFRDYIRKIYELISALSSFYQVPIRIRRFIPNDFRRENFWLAERLANSGYLRILKGMPFREHFRLARIFNNLRIDIRNVIRQNELRNVIHTTDELWTEIEQLLRGNL